MMSTALGGICVLCGMRRSLSQSFSAASGERPRTTAAAPRSYTSGANSRYGPLCSALATCHCIDPGKESLIKAAHRIGI